MFFGSLGFSEARNDLRGKIGLGDACCRMGMSGAIPSRWLHGRCRRITRHSLKPRFSGGLVSWEIIVLGQGHRALQEGGLFREGICSVCRFKDAEQIRPTDVHTVLKILSIAFPLASSSTSLSR